MMDLLTLSTTRPYGHRYSRLYLHPLHLRLQKRKEVHMKIYGFGISTQD